MKVASRTPGVVPVFDGPLDAFHFAFGLLAAKSTRFRVPVTGAFVAYQLAEKETIESSIGDLIEFGVGYAVGALIL